PQARRPPIVPNRAGREPVRDGLACRSAPPTRIHGGQTRLGPYTGCVAGGARTGWHAQLTIPEDEKPSKDRPQAGTTACPMNEARARNVRDGPSRIPQPSGFQEIPEHLGGRERRRCELAGTLVQAVPNLSRSGVFCQREE